MHARVTGEETYPFVPRSNRRLRPGHFWSVPLRDGSFACGRVIELPPPGDYGSRSCFLAGLLDWHSAENPTCASIAGRACVEQGNAHLKSITEQGGAILGYRSLDPDGIEPFLFLDRENAPRALVVRGYKELRPASPVDASLPVFSTWGFNVIRVIAEERFL